MRSPVPLTVACFVICALPFASALAQATCSSDGERPPAALVERFISADCDTCWRDPSTPKAKPGELALDWIVPSAKGDDAPLSAVALRDASWRLQALKQPSPRQTFNLRRPTPIKPVILRVARGVALGGYMGASITLTPAVGAALSSQPMKAHLLLVEDIPAGTDGTPVARHLVRNSLEITWNEPRRTGSAPTQRPTPPRLEESRPMSIPEGANPDRIRVVGWVEDATGKLIASAASVCRE